MSTKRIAAYMRISVDTEKDRDNTSIENQRKIITQTYYLIVLILFLFV